MTRGDKLTDMLAAFLSETAVWTVQQYGFDMWIVHDARRKSHGPDDSHIRKQFNNNDDATAYVRYKGMEQVLQVVEGFDDEQT